MIRLFYNKYEVLSYLEKATININILLEIDKSLDCILEDIMEIVKE